MMLLKDYSQENSKLLGIVITILLLTTFVVFKLVDNVMQFGRLDLSMINFITLDIVTFQMIVSIPTQMLFVLLFRKIFEKLSHVEFRDSYLFQLLIVSVIYCALIFVFRMRYYPNYDMFLQVFLWLFILFTVTFSVIYRDQIPKIVLSSFSAIIVVTVFFVIFGLLLFLLIASLFGAY